MAEDILDEKPDDCGVIGAQGLSAGYERNEMNAWLEKLKTHYETIEKQAETLKFLFGEEGVKTANLEKIQIWRHKADLWDQYAIYDNDQKEEILVKDLITAYEKLEAVKTIIAEVEKKETIGSRRMRATTHYMKILKILAGEA